MSTDQEKTVRERTEQALRNVSERHLMAEEKWLINAMNRIREQINALRVEGLALQSHKVEVRNEYIKCLSKYNDTEPSTEFLLDSLPALPDWSATEMPTPTVIYESAPSDAESDSPAEDFSMIEGTCNEQKLNLKVPSNSEHVIKQWDSEDPEEESEEEWNNVNLDMDMLVGDGEQVLGL